MQRQKRLLSKEGGRFCLHESGAKIGAMPIPAVVAELVERFERNYRAYVAPTYNEEQLRIEFVNPFFMALGWDVSNIAGFAEAYKDVIHEDALKMGGTTKAPDYSFRIGGQRKFFLETKRPGVNIALDPAPALQLRRYAYTAALPLSILSNFRDLAVYDGRIQPDKKDAPAKARLKLIPFGEYAERWDEIAALFSPDSIRRGAFDAYATEKTRRGTATFDVAFLREIEGWRASLATHIALRNALSPEDLNLAVGRIIDRIIFLRICEENGIEPRLPLMALRNGVNTYTRLVEQFHRADARYNSGLFHFRTEPNRHEEPDELTTLLKLDNKPIKEILARLYFPDSPYAFNVMPLEILGQIYEQFLGKVIRLEGKSAVVEEKPEVKKAGGVYYTPSYIVNHIVEETVGALCRDKTPTQVARLKVLDPACGSGSFLLGAYEYLLRWHLDWYLANDPEKHARGKTPPISRVAVNDPTVSHAWRLTPRERKRIVRDNIFGVDIDRQAIEVTKLSLLLKVLEGESDESISNQLRLLHERALPDLGDNIKCGNSLIDPDFEFDSQGNPKTLSEEERKRVNPFSWAHEYSSITKAGGFDAIIGNPPYIFGEYHDQSTQEHLQEKLKLANGQYDTYWLFIEKSLQLTAPHGYFSMIVPDALLARDEARDVRDLLLTQGLESIYHCGLVFQAGISAVVFTVAKGSKHTSVDSKVRNGTQATTEHTCTKQRFLSDPQRRLLVHASDAEWRMIEKMQIGSKPLSEYVKMSRGEETGKKHVAANGLAPILVGEDISRYFTKSPSRFVDKVSKSPTLYQAPKIVLVKTGSRCIAALDEQGLVTMQSLYNGHARDPQVELLPILAVLNSRLISFYVSKMFTAYKLLFPQLNQTTIEQIPIPNKIHDKARHDTMVKLVERMLELQKQKAQAKTVATQSGLESQIAATDAQIDKLVYALYDLSEDEIAIIERRDADGGT